MSGVTGVLWLLVTARRLHHRRPCLPWGEPHRPMRTPAHRHGRPGPRRTRPAESRPAECAGARARDRPALGAARAPVGHRRPARRSPSGSTSPPPRAGPGSSSRPATAGRTPRSGWCSALCCAIVLLHDRHQAFGWALGWIGIFWGVDGLAQSYVRYGVRADDALAGVNAALWVLNRFGAFLPMTVAVLLLIFPTGRFLEGRWGRVGQVTLALMFLAALLVDPGPGQRPRQRRRRSRPAWTSTPARSRCPRRSPTRPSR